MIGRLHRVGQGAWRFFWRPLSRAFASDENPLNHLGALTIFFCWIVLISGIWLTIFFRTSVSGAFDSVEYLTHEQRYLGGIMRSLHRYASDAAIVTILLHVVREFVFDRYRRNRWFTWLTGMPLIWMMFPLGITGYWLVWDELAQYVAISSAELLDRLPVFTDSMAGNFLSDDVLSDRFFTLMAFLHLIGLPIFLVFGIWLHVFRLNGPRINPPRRLMAGALLCMLVLSAVFPAVSHDRADLAATPQVLKLDWFYLHFYPLIETWSPGWVWLLLVAISAVVVLAPWVPPAKRENAALVSLEFCNGCKRCADDCPFGAIEMVARSDGKSYAHEAAVDPELCISCGICVGACPTATPFRSHGDLTPGIDLPLSPMAALREEITQSSSDVIIFGCRNDRRIAQMKGEGQRVIELECMGQLPPSFVDFTLSRGFAKGVFLLGCEDGNCNFRLGGDWTEQRIARDRDPMLRRRVNVDRVALAWLEPWSDYADIDDAVAAFAARVSES